MAAIHAANPNRGLAPEPLIGEMSYMEAVGQIRRQVFKRDDYCCVNCSAMVVWERHRPNSGEMDEVQARGNCIQSQDGHYRSGEISVANCQTLCKKCHTGPGGKQDRSPSFHKSLPGKSPIQVVNASIQDAVSFADQYQKHRNNQ
jgi:hypothetical protein